MKKNPLSLRGRNVTQQILNGITREREHLYISGAVDRVQAELALTRLSIYHKPSYNRNGSWDYQAEARIRGGSPSPKQYDWEDEPEFRRDADADEPEGRPELRTQGSSVVAIAHHDEPCPVPPAAPRLSAPKRKVLTHVK